MRKVEFQTVCHMADSLALHRAYSAQFNYPAPKASSERLAVVGGGASASHHIPELTAWDGDVWGINGAATWCIERGFGATLFSASPAESPRRYLTGITKAILADSCHPWTFDGLKHAELAMFDPEDNGPTSVTVAAVLAPQIGYREIHYFGCEGCYGETTHLYQDTPIPSDMLVDIDGVVYRTNVGYFIQSQFLAKMINAFPPHFKDRSGGLLGALVADPDGWDVITLPCEMKDAA